LNAPKFRPKAGVNALETCFWGAQQSCLLLLFIFGMACQRQTMDSVFMGDLFCELAFSAKLNSSELPRSMNSDGMVAGLWLRNQSQEIN